MALAFIQGAKTNVPAADGGSHSYGTSVTNGNKVIVIAWRWSDTRNVPFLAGHCLQTGGTATVGAFTLLAEEQSLYNGINYVQVGIWAAQVTSTGSLTVSIAGSGGVDYMSIVGTEVSAGSWDAGYVENTVINQSVADNVSPATSGNVSSAGPAIFMGVLALATTSVITITPDGAFTQIAEEEDGVNQQEGSAIYKIVASGNTDAFDWTVGNNLGWAVAGVVLKEVAGGGGGGDELMGQAMM